MVTWRPTIVNLKKDDMVVKLYRRVENTVLVTVPWWRGRLNLSVKLAGLAVSDHVLKFHRVDCTADDEKLVVRQHFPYVWDEYFEGLPMSSLKVLCWNFTLVTDNNFKRDFRKVVGAVDPDVFVLVNCSASLGDLVVFFIEQGYPAFSVACPGGFNSGSWVLWKSKTSSVNVSECTEEIFLSEIWKPDYGRWLCTNMKWLRDCSPPEQHAPASPRISEGVSIIRSRNDLNSLS